jgi:hypothetical protein
MTDEPREENPNQPEDEEVEAHSPMGAPTGAPTGAPVGEAHRSDDDEDVEAHSAPIGAPISDPELL